MAKEDTFDVYTTMEVTPVNDRSQVIISVDIRDAGKPWCSTLLIYHDVPDEAVDYITYCFDSIAVGESAMAIEGTSEQFVLQLEGQCIEMLRQLHELGKQNHGKSRAEKDAAAKKMVRELGIEGKGKRHKDRNKDK